MISDRPELTLPHRDPFVWVHRLIERNDAGDDGIVELDIHPDNPIFRGHFPDNPIFPGVLQMEAGAQACLWVYLGELAPGAPQPEVRFVAVESYKFKRPVVPPATMQIHAKERLQKAGLYLWDISCKVDGQLVSTGAFWLQMKFAGERK